MKLRAIELPAEPVEFEKVPSLDGAEMRDDAEQLFKLLLDSVPSGTLDYLAATMLEYDAERLEAIELAEAAKFYRGKMLDDYFSGA
jgi:hypothetical protein